MIKKYQIFIQGISRRKWLISALVLLFLLFNFLVFPLATKNEPRMLDTRLHYNRANIIAYLFQLTPSQKSSQILMHTTIDLLYPILYTLLLSTLLFISGKKHRNLLVLLPLSIFIFDILENSGIVVLFSRIPHTNVLYRTALTITPLFTMVKWLCAGISSIALSVAVIRYVISK